MCKRIWDQEADPVTQSHSMLSPRVNLEKQGGLVPNSGSDYATVQMAQLPSATDPLRSEGPSPCPGGPAGLGSR